MTVLAQTDFDGTDLLSDVNGENYTQDGTLEWGVVAQRFASGALVVGFGSCQWAWGLDATHDRGGDVETEDVRACADEPARRPRRHSGRHPDRGADRPAPVSLNGYGLVPAGGVPLQARFHLLVDGEWRQLEWAA